MHRPMLVFRQPNLLCIDGIPVSPEERTKAEMYFLEQQVCRIFVKNSSIFTKKLYFVFLVTFVQAHRH